MRRPRGVALATALMLLALVLVIGLALASTSMMSLNLARQGYQDARCSYRARSGVNELVARLQKLEGDRQIQLFNPRPLDLAVALPGTVELVPGCFVTFDRNAEGHSVDNLMNEQPAAGWLDRGRTSKSVPPFTMELLLHAEDGGFKRTYRALVRRVWPYAIYSGGGPVVLTGRPGNPPAEPAGSSHVTGTVFAQLKDGLGVSAPEMSPRALLYRMLTVGLKPEIDYTRPVQVGPPVVWAPGTVAVSGVGIPRAESVPVLYDILNRTVPVETRQSRGNELNGSVDYFHENGRREGAVEVFPDNGWSGRLNVKVAPPKAPSIHPPSTSGYWAWTPQHRVWSTPYLKEDGYQATEWTRPTGHVVGGWHPPNGYPPNPDAVPNWLLFGVHGFGSHQGSIVIHGNVANRIVCDGWDRVAQSTIGFLTVAEYPFELKLDDCVLYIKGDADFSNTPGDDPTIKGVIGNGATLIVDGKLSLTGASLRAGDRGMVIYAQSIVISGECDFNGLLVAGSVTMLPAPGKQIKIRGGIFTGGTDMAGSPGVTLLNADVQYDPRYMKSLNGYGEYRLTAWEPL